jgi:hypothetical protein
VEGEAAQVQAALAQLAAAGVTVEEHAA